MRGGLTKKQIAACIKQMSGKYAPQVVFADWIQCVALSISNSVQIFHDNLWQQREEQYLATMNRYGKEERMKMAEMAGMLILTYEKGLGDVLGEVYMCYVQLSLLGVKAIVAQGEHIIRTVYSKPFERKGVLHACEAWTFDINEKEK